VVLVLEVVKWVATLDVKAKVKAELKMKSIFLKHDYKAQKAHRDWVCVRGGWQ